MTHPVWHIHCQVGFQTEHIIIILTVRYKKKNKKKNHITRSAEDEFIVHTQYDNYRTYGKTLDIYGVVYDI